jgi:ribonuclease VapC
VIVRCVLDASAVLALLRDEPGADVVEEAISRGAAVSSVNLSEVCAKLNDYGVAPGQVSQTIDDLSLVIEPFLRSDAECAGAWRAETRQRGLSLGDRACLALAYRLGQPAVSTDRAWQNLALPVEVRVIVRGGSL